MLCIAAVALLTACAGGETSGEATPWEAATEARLLMARGTEGGYGGFPSASDLQATLYSTYYAVQTYAALGLEPPNREETVRWLQAFEPPQGVHPVQYAQVVGLSTGNDLLVAHMRVMALAALGEKPPDAQRVASFVRELMLPNGAFAESPDAPQRAHSRSTRNALEVLAALNETDGLTATKDWLLAEWQDLPVTGGVEDALALQNIVRGLEVLGVDPAALPGWEEHRRAIGERLEQTVTETRASLVDVRALSNAAAVLGVDQARFADDMAARLAAHRLPGGGYTAVGGDAPDVQGAFMAVKLLQRANPSGLEPDERESIVSWLNALTAVPGGFRQPALNLPNPDSTALAIRSLQLVGSAAADDEASFGYLIAGVENGLGPGAAYQLMRLVPQEDLPEAARERLASDAEAYLGEWDGTFQSHRDMEIALGWVRVLRGLRDGPSEAAHRKLETSLSQMDDSAGCYGPAQQSDLQVTFFAVSILQALEDESIDGEECVAWLRAQQSAEGGFQLGGIPNIIATYYGVASLEVLDSEPADVSALEAWLEAAQDQLGGYHYIPPSSEYAAQASEEATMTSTWMGLETRELLR